MPQFRSKLLMSGMIFFSLLSGVRSQTVGPDPEFNAQFRQDIGGWIAADATYSIYLPDGRTLWLFGDTFIGEVNPDSSIVDGSKFIRNSGVIQDDSTLKTLFSGTRENPGDLIYTKNPDSTWYWPEHGVVDRDTLRIFVAKFRKDPDGPPGFQFAHAGNDIASFSWPELEYIKSDVIPYHDSNNVIYGDRILEVGDFWYIYGRRNDNPEFNISYPYVARALKGEIMGNWEFFDGTGWSDDPVDSHAINDFQVSQQYSVHRKEDRYILLTQDIWLSPKIWTFSSGSPVGPWENKTLVYETPILFESMFTYNAYAHPQFDQDHALLMSYNSNGDFRSIFNNVELYRPRFVRIPYSMTDPSFIDSASLETDLVTVFPARNITIYPNPFDSRISFSIELFQKEELSIELFTLTGQLIGQPLHGSYPAGKHCFEYPSAGLSPGAYFFRLSAGNKIHSGLLIKKRE